MNTPTWFLRISVWPCGADPQGTAILILVQDGRPLPAILTVWAPNGKEHALAFVVYVLNLSPRAIGPLTWETQPSTDPLPQVLVDLLNK
jgi:hypothetical protein